MRLPQRFAREFRIAWPVNVRLAPEERYNVPFNVGYYSIGYDLSVHLSQLLME